MIATVTTDKTEQTVLRRSIRAHARMLEGERGDLHRAYLGSIDALLTALEARDLYTRGHSERVHAWAVRIAWQLDLPLLQVEEIGQAARLHDIGKVGIRDAILEKPGPLSPEEWQVMRSHPLVGVGTLASIKLLQSALPIIRGHHERWDGKGYPDGLRGKNIPIGARIVAVADSYDALTSDRPYRRGFDRKEAWRILSEGAGVQWDEQVVAALLAVQSGSTAVRTKAAKPARPIEDPICGMAVIPAHAPARARYQERDFYFCSSACREAFDRGPENYV